METKLLCIKNIMEDGALINEAAELLKQGEPVAIPTETVYGLAANALDEDAVAKIFIAKGRPQDNPLIVHIAEVYDVEKVATDIPKSAILLADAFWPGPLTMILKKCDAIPNVVTAGLDSVGIRCPRHRVARAIIHAAGVPLAAPSANTSGRPSPTCAAHVMDDMNGKIPAIVDGGECEVGLESTIVDMTCIPPRLLRPGGISLRALRDVLGEIEIDDAVLHELAPGTVVRAPGMKYRHYAPKAPVVILDGATDAAAQYVKEHCDGGKTAILCFSEECEAFADCGAVVVPYGSADNTEELAHRLFFELRQLDEACVDKIFAREPKASDGLELAVINRLQKAAGFLRVTL